MGVSVISDHGRCQSPTTEDALAATTEDNSDPAEEDVNNIQQENVDEGHLIEGSGQDELGVGSYVQDEAEDGSEGNGQEEREDPNQQERKVKMITNCFSKLHGQTECGVEATVILMHHLLFFSLRMLLHFHLVMMILFFLEH